MDEEVEDLPTSDSSKAKEEPWCSACHANTDYRRKWGTVTRGDLNGGAYSEIYEIPHCIACQRPMSMVSNSRRLVYAVNTVAVLTWAAGFLCVICLFGIGTKSLLGLLGHTSLCWLISRLPKESRKNLLSWKRAKRDAALQDLLKQL